ncbi:DUF4955 domain-containing protein [Dysgonomonas sp. 511]|uniref:DUF4955 domain-containing protein n=1 Tax=Dysgonomonas sp. 511 TaxID=2302930 RepID=UPI0013D2EACB|nr:DUF4955 domain-containing protein [Dysgonomonas sp. 511]NDV78781.1 DUF4955 domain-containing protein [Dysgonomonas sp. 511]
MSTHILRTGLLFLAVFLFGSSFTVNLLYADDKPNSKVVTGDNVSRLWLEFVEAQRTGSETTLLDFSYAGYHHSEVEVPKAKHTIFNVCDYGAKPNDGKSDRKAMIAAIAAAEKNGSGIIYFPRGRYDLHAEGDPNDAIVIRSSNIVLRGDGMGEGGTEIFMELPNPATDPNKMWTSPDLILFRTKGAKSKLTDVTKNASRGSFSVEVADASMLKSGDWICLELKNNDPELVAAELAPYEVNPKWTDLTVKGVQVNDYHQIVKTEGNTVWFKEPVMKEVESKWGWCLRKFPHIEEVGVEDIAFVGNFHEEFVHHKNWLHDGGYKMFSMNGVVNSWVRRCSFTNVSECISIISSANVSVYDCKITGNIGHSAMRAQGSSRVFFGKIDDQPAMWHSVGVSKPAMGNVIWRGRTNSNSCFESHASQPRATLFDACESGFMRHRAGGSERNNPNHLSDLFLWNFRETDTPEENFDWWASDSRFWKFMPPVIVGFHGSGTTFNCEQVVVEESNGKPVQPESLFEAQLELRLGYLPQWLVKLKSK